MLIAANLIEVLEDLDVIELRRQREREVVVAQRRHRIWTRLWLLRRPELGHYETLISELEDEDEAGFVGYLRVKPEIFYELVHVLSPRLTKIGCNWRKPLEVGLKLAVTLRFLATGDCSQFVMSQIHDFAHFE